MKTILEKEINDVLQKLENESIDLDSTLVSFTKWQPFFFQFLSSENFKLLKEKEFDLLIFLLSTIFLVSEQIGEETIEAKLIEELDEQNWTILNDSASFENAKDQFFNKYEQEDLLAFVEDSLVEDNEELVTQVGKEIIFLTTKTFIDCLNTIN